MYEAGIICARDEDGQLRLNSRGEKVINTRQWAYLRTNQRIALRRQSIGRADWEKLPWTGHMCYVFTRSWEMGGVRSFYMRTGQRNQIANFFDRLQIEWHRLDERHRRANGMGKQILD